MKDINTDELDVVTGEFARQSSTIPSKLYRDLLKSALTTKVHLNAVLKRVPYLPATKIKTVVVPMIQIMGLSCVLYGMNIIDKKVYTLQKIPSINYPSTQREVKSGGIKSLSDGFALVEYISPVIKCPSSENVEDEVDRQEDDDVVIGNDIAIKAEDTMKLLEFFKLESTSDAQLKDHLARTKNGEAIERENGPKLSDVKVTSKVIERSKDVPIEHLQNFIQYI
ncbi:hypothetical protein HPULCUR_003984 [Helicostylum pulchrum]|uniref:Uncharacterized protein n=1 Tax=Helicostylum pulchrum TaxID=562976 RepID=A0ABP9XUY2_9FUNG